MRAGELPASGYTLEVNGKLNAAFAILDGATARSHEDVSQYLRFESLTCSRNFAGSPDSLNLVFLAFRVGAYGKCHTGLS